MTIQSIICIITLLKSEKQLQPPNLNATNLVIKMKTFKYVMTSTCVTSFRTYLASKI